MTFSHSISNNFFELFSLPIDFNVDQQLLNNRLKSLQKQFHPDSVADDANTSDTLNASSVDTKDLSYKNSAIINHAFSILANADSRAKYLLELADQHIDSNQTISDTEFLTNAMTLRMDLDDLASNCDLTAIKQLQFQVEQLIDDHSKLFAVNYDKKNWDVSIDSTQKLQFLVKLHKDILSCIDDCYQSLNTNDDDLYL